MNGSKIESYRKRNRAGLMAAAGPATAVEGVVEEVCEDVLDTRPRGAGRLIVAERLGERRGAPGARGPGEDGDRGQRGVRRLRVAIVGDLPEGSGLTQLQHELIDLGARDLNDLNAVAGASAGAAAAA